MTFSLFCTAFWDWLIERDLTLSYQDHRYVLLPVVNQTLSRIACQITWKCSSTHQNSSWFIRCQNNVGLFSFSVAVSHIWARKCFDNEKVLTIMFFIIQLPTAKIRPNIWSLVCYLGQSHSYHGGNELLSFSSPSH